MDRPDAPPDFVALSEGDDVDVVNNDCLQPSSSTFSTDYAHSDLSRSSPVNAPSLSTLVSPAVTTSSTTLALGGASDHTVSEPTTVSSSSTPHSSHGRPFVAHTGASSDVPLHTSIKCVIAPKSPHASTSSSQPVAAKGPAFESYLLPHGGFSAYSSVTVAVTLVPEQELQNDYDYHQSLDLLPYSGPRADNVWMLQRTSGSSSANALALQAQLEHEPPLVLGERWVEIDGEANVLSEEERAAFSAALVPGARDYILNGDLRFFEAPADDVEQDRDDASSLFGEDDDVDLDPAGTADDEVLAPTSGEAVQAAPDASSHAFGVPDEREILYQPQVAPQIETPESSAQPEAQPDGAAIDAENPEYADSPSASSTQGSPSLLPANEIAGISSFDALEQLAPHVFLEIPSQSSVQDWGSADAAPLLAGTLVARSGANYESSSFDPDDAWSSPAPVLAADHAEPSRPPGIPLGWEVPSQAMPPPPPPSAPAAPNVGYQLAMTPVPGTGMGRYGAPQNHGPPHVQTGPSFPQNNTMFYRNSAHNALIQQNNAFLSLAPTPDMPDYEVHMAAFLRAQQRLLAGQQQAQAQAQLRARQLAQQQHLMQQQQYQQLAQQQQLAQNHQLAQQQQQHLVPRQQQLPRFVQQQQQLVNPQQRFAQQQLLQFEARQRQLPALHPQHAWSPDGAQLASHMNMNMPSTAGQEQQQGAWYPASTQLGAAPGQAQATSTSNARSTVGYAQRLGHGQSASANTNTETETKTHASTTMAGDMFARGYAQTPTPAPTPRLAHQPMPMPMHGSEHGQQGAHGARAFGGTGAGVFGGQRQVQSQGQGGQLGMWPPAAPAQYRYPAGRTGVASSSGSGSTNGGARKRMAGAAADGDGDGAEDGAGRAQKRQRR